VIRKLGGLRSDRSERGAITILAAVFMTVLVFAAALSVDIGGRVQEIRRAQATADLAAMDASRDLSSDAATQDLAWRSALRNNVDHTKPGYTVTATRGTVSNGVFTATGSNPTAVQVRVTTPYHDFFGGSSATLSASAVASNTGLAQFALGATLVDINTGLLSFGANLALVGYNGLVAGTVTLGALATQLGLSALTPDQILASPVSVGQLVKAGANLLSASNPSASVNLSALGSTLLSKSYNNNNPISLGQALGLAQGTGVGVGASVNLLQAVSGSVELANQKAGINLNLNLNLVGLAGASLALTAITPPTVSPYGAPGITATNTQVTLNLTLDINVPLVLTAHLPLSVTIGATGTLKSVNCAGLTPMSIGLGTQFQALNLVVQPGAMVSAVLGLLSGSLSGNILIASTSVADTILNNASNFIPNQSPVTANLGLGVTTPNLVGSGALGGLIATLVNTVASVIGPVLSAATGALGALGINVGVVDYLGVRSACATPKLGL
jgi:uncharacterized membrane protein